MSLKGESNWTRAKSPRRPCNNNISTGRQTRRDYTDYCHDENYLFLRYEGVIRGLQHHLSNNPFPGSDSPLIRDSTGNLVHPDGKYRLIGLVLGNTWYNQRSFHPFSRFISGRVLGGSSTRLTCLYLVLVNPHTSEIPSFHRFSGRFPPYSPITPTSTSRCLGPSNSQK